MIKRIMKKLDKQILITVLAVHVLILFLIWGGLSALGTGVVLLIPLLGGTSYISFEKGKRCRTNTKKNVSGEFNYNSFIPFRG